MFIAEYKYSFFLFLTVILLTILQNTILKIPFARQLILTSQNRFFSQQQEGSKVRMQAFACIYLGTLALIFLKFGF